jgi:hypothetical protein
VSPAPSPTNASSSLLSLSAATASSSKDAAAVMTQQAAVPGVAVEPVVAGGLQVDTSLTVGLSSMGGGSGTAPPTPCPSPPPNGLNGGPLASRPSVSEFLTPLRQSHLSRLADLYMTQLMAGQCNLSDAKQSLSFLSSSLAATPDPGPASSLTPSQSVGMVTGYPTSTTSFPPLPSSVSSSSSSSSNSNGNGNGSNGNAAGAVHDVFAFDNPYMRNFR